MLEAGSYHVLSVNRISDYGLYLADEEGNEVLLPNRYVSLENHVGDRMEVFVYHDSEDRLVASTESPLAVVGETAFLRVVDKTIHGAFLDWGLTAKDLFLPNRNMVGYVDAGQKYVVYVYRDRVTGRAVATMSLKGFISNEHLSVSPRQEVDIMVALETPLGFRVVINNLHWGMIYRNQIFSPVKVGDTMKAFVSKITDDNRIDVSLQQQGYDQVRASADKIVALLQARGGRMALGDDSSPEEITAATGMSKKVFKRSVGYLLKKGTVEMDGKGIRIKK